jgi:hypothetical protein
MMPRLWARIARKQDTATVAEDSETLVRESASVPLETEIDPKTGSSGITFVVDSVTQADKPVWCETLAGSLARRFQRKTLVLPGERDDVINKMIDSLIESPRPIDEKERARMMSRLGSRCHPFVDAVHIAFSDHRPLALSPDAIWLLIAQGFSHHVAENAESLRPRLVRHKGKRELKVEASDLTLAGFEKAISGFSSLIHQEIDSVLHETLICNFSTTTPAVRTASEVALMDSFSSYFTYGFMCVCGIPKITIQGTPADWRRIRARVEVIATYGLEWWASRLRPILDEFVLAAEGRPTLNFWQAIYKPKDAYGDNVVTGWVADLFPYLGDAPERRRNHVFDHERHNWTLAVDQGVETATLYNHPLARAGVRLKSFPSGLSSARLKVSFKNRPSVDVDLVAGFLAVRQDPSDLTLSPLISWCVAELPPEKPIMIF